MANELILVNMGKYKPVEMKKKLSLDERLSSLPVNTYNQVTLEKWVVEKESFMIDDVEQKV